MYRVRGEVFDRLVSTHLGETGEQLRAVRVLDIGSGTGFYVDRWVKLGADVTGVDLTEVAVVRLAVTHPDCRFIKADIGCELSAELETLVGTMDAISAFDVLFHIVDDAAYHQALVNCGRLLREGGRLIWSDDFVHGPSLRARHRVSRSLPEAEQALAGAGLAVVDRVPMFVLMNQPLDTQSRVHQAAWKALVSPAVLSDRLGGVLGAALYPLERRLVRRLRESPTTEVMVCVKRSPDTSSLLARP